MECKEETVQNPGRCVGNGTSSLCLWDTVSKVSHRHPEQSVLLLNRDGGEEDEEEEEEMMREVQMKRRRTTAQNVSSLRYNIRSLKAF